MTYLNYVSDQFSGFHAIVVPETLRDSMFILDGLLEQQTVLDPTEVMADTASYSDWVFGCSSCSATSSARGWPTSARRGSGGLTLGPTTDRSTLWLATAQHRAHRRELGGPAPGGRLARYRQDRALRVPAQAAGRLALGHPGRRARRARPHPQDAYTCSSSSAAPPILVQLNRQEARHRLARRLFHGHRGQLRQGYGEGQEDQLGALGLVLNILVLWTTRYLEAALDQLDRTGHSIDTKNVERLSPLKFRNVNLHGKYSFVLSEDVARGRCALSGTAASPTRTTSAREPGFPFRCYSQAEFPSSPALYEVVRAVGGDDEGSTP